MEDDLFGSSSLFESFENKRESRIKSSECEIVSDSGEGSSREEEEEEGGGVVLKDEAASVTQTSLVILDETGSEEERASIEEVSKVEADSDIEVLDDSESTTELSSDPTNEKTNGIVNVDDKECKCTSCPHLKAVKKLQRENEQLRKQIEDMKSQHQIEIRRLEQLVATSSSEVAVVTVNKCESYSGFCIDKKGLESTAPVEGTWRVPSYNMSFSGALNTPEIIVEEDLNANRLKSIKATCFNCLGDHMLHECSEKKDPQRISRNRQDFMNRNGGKQIRYHAENDLRFARFQPGRISEELRSALSLGRKELPFYIYKMRRLGYPPGWLKEAEISSSGISVYDFEGKAVIGENEDGEVKEISAPKVQYDPKLLIGYPGYNVWLPQGVRDEWKRYGFPAIQDDHVRTFTALRKQAKKSKTVKRKRKLSGRQNAKRRRVSGEDMDIEEGEDDSSPTQPLPPGVDPKDSSDECVKMTNNGCGSLPKDEESSGSESPSLEDLESAKRRLMNQLIVDGSDSPLGGDSSGARTPKSKAPNCLKNEGDEKPGFSASKFVQLGSPSFFQASKGLRLPSPEKFAAGISEHIPFENLPDSVGKYQTMKRILEKVRRVRSSTP